MLWSAREKYFTFSSWPMFITQPVVGVDVSKATLAVCHQVGAHVQHLEVANTLVGFRQLVRCGGATSLYVLEATGPSYLAVAYHLVAAGAQVAVFNPLVVKRFIQMHLDKGKADRKDAQWLLRYGQQQTTPRWQPEEELLVECRQLEQVIELLIRQKNMVHNALEALQAQPIVSPAAFRAVALAPAALKRAGAATRNQAVDDGRSAVSTRNAATLLHF